MGANPPYKNLLKIRGVDRCSTPPIQNSGGGAANPPTPSCLAPLRMLMVTKLFNNWPYLFLSNNIPSNVAVNDFVREATQNVVSSVTGSACSTSAKPYPVSSTGYPSSTMLTDTPGMLRHVSRFSTNPVKVDLS